MLDKYGLYMQHFKNILVDIVKKADKATLEGTHCQLLKTETVILGALMYDLLQPAQKLSLKIQEVQVDLINMPDLTGQTRRRYKSLQNKIKTQSNVLTEFPMLKNNLSKVKSTNFFGDRSR